MLLKFRHAFVSVDIRIVCTSIIQITNEIKHACRFLQYDDDDDTEQ